jgi:hypothetical protein
LSTKVGSSALRSAQARWRALRRSGSPARERHPHGDLQLQSQGQGWQVRGVLVIMKAPHVDDIDSARSCSHKLSSLSCGLVSAGVQGGGGVLVGVTCMGLAWALACVRTAAPNLHAPPRPCPDLLSVSGVWEPSCPHSAPASETRRRRRVRAAALAAWLIQCNRRPLTL